MKYLIFIILIIFTFLPTTFAFGESYFCTDEIRTGIFKDKEKWTTKEIKELNFTVKVEGIKIDFKIHGENPLVDARILSMIKLLIFINVPILQMDGENLRIFIMKYLVSVLVN